RRHRPRSRTARGRRRGSSSAFLRVRALCVLSVPNHAPLLNNVKLGCSVWFVKGGRTRERDALGPAGGTPAFLAVPERGRLGRWSGSVSLPGEREVRTKRR